MVAPVEILGEKPWGQCVPLLRLFYASQCICGRLCTHDSEHYGFHPMDEMSFRVHGMLLRLISCLYQFVCSVPKYIWSIDASILKLGVESNLGPVTSKPVCPNVNNSYTSNVGVHFQETIYLYWISLYIITPAHASVSTKICLSFYALKIMFNKKWYKNSWNVAAWKRADVKIWKALPVVLKPNCNS